MRNSKPIEPLIRFRKQKGLSQTDAARFFGLEEKNSYKTLAAWENGSSKPSEKHRAKFIEYLSDVLGMKDNPGELFALWELIHTKWGWDELTEVEKQSFIEEKKTPIIDWENADPADLMTQMNRRDPGRSSSATRAAIAMVDQGKLPIQFLLGANQAPYWLVRKLILEYLIQQESKETLNFLHAFRDTSYHVSQAVIRGFIRNQFQEGKFDRSQLSQSIEILDSLSKAPKVTDASRGKDIKLLEEIKAFLASLEEPKNGSKTRDET